MRELTVVVPTRNEAGNVMRVVESLKRELQGLDWDVLFVDDESDDGTYQKLVEIAGQEDQVRYWRRIGRRDLSSACIEGILSSSSPFVAVMDADLQHDPALLPAMLDRLKQGRCDLVVGSRYNEGGSAAGLGRYRAWLSRLGTRLSTGALGIRLSDPLSGFFMMRREVVETLHRRLRARGFKLLLDILTIGGRDLRVDELPYRMRERQTGDSKLGASVLAEFIVMVVARFAGRLIPVDFVRYSLVGLSGVAVHLSILAVVHGLLDVPFTPAQIVAVVAAMTSNFVLNNLYTFRAHRLYGAAFFQGLLSFYLVCALGAVVGIAVGDLLYRVDFPWWLAGAATTLISAFWNFAMSSMFTWKRS